MSGAVPASAMVLAAGLGKRMRPITDRLPKPLVEVGGATLIDRGLDALAQAGVARAVVNVHHLASQLVAHLAAREHPRIAISDESGELLDSGGGVVKALPLLGAGPFFLLNADTFWVEREGSSLRRLAAAWDDSRMDLLLLLADPAHATGHGEGTDFLIGPEGRLARSGGAADGFIYAGVGIVHPRLLDSAPKGAHSLNLHFDRAIAAGRLFGQVLDGHWITVGTPQAVEDAERALARLEGR